MSGEVLNLTVTEQTLFNLTITADDSTVTEVQTTTDNIIINTSMDEIDATMVNNGTGLGVYKQKDMTKFIMRSITDDDKTIDTSLQNSNDEIRIKLPDAGISTPDNFQINADSDSSAKIELPGPTVDLSKAKLLTDLDVNSKDLDSVATITATTGAITTVNATTINTSDLNVSDDLVVTDDLTVHGGVQIAENLDVYGNATFNENINQSIGKTATLPTLNSSNISGGNVTISNANINGGEIDNTTVGAGGSSSGRFTTLESASVDINGGAIDGTTIGATTPSTIVTTDLTATTVDINAGTIDNTTIGATTPSTIVTTNLTATTADINAGTIDNTVIGATTPVAGTFTTATATTGVITTVNATDVNVSDDLVVTDDASVGGDLGVTGNTVLTGNLTVNGTTTTVNTETINLADNNILINSNHTGSPTQDGGITIERGTSDDALFQWNETTDVFEFKEGSSYADIKADKAEFTDTVSIGGTTPNVVGAVDLAVADSFTVGGDMTVNGTSHFSVLGFTNRIKVDCNTLATTSGHGIVLWDSTRATNDLTTSNNADDILHPNGTAPTFDSGDSPVNYITNESIEMHLDAIGTGGPGETHTNITAGKLNVQLGDTTEDGETTIYGGNIGATRSVVVGGTTPYISSNSFSNPGGFFTTVVPSIATGEPSQDRHWHGSFLGSAGKEFAQLHVKEIYGTEMHGDLIPGEDNEHSLGSASKQWKEVFVGPGSLYIDGHKVLGSDDSGTINISTDTGQTLDILAGGGSGTAGAVNIASRSNVTNLNDTTVNLGPSVGGGSINARGTLEAPDLHNGALEFSGTLINQTDTNQNLEIRTNGTGYLHANVADLYVGPLTGAVKIDESSISVSNTNGDLNLTSNGTGTVNIDDFEISHYSQFGENFGKINATGTDQNLCLQATNGTGYFVVNSPNQYFGAASGVKITNAPGSATTLSGHGYQGEALNITGNLSGNLTANATTENLTTKNVKANPSSVTIPAAPNMGNWDYSADTGHALVGIGKFMTGHPIVGITQTDNVNESQPKAMFLVNHMDYDHSGSGSALGGHGVAVDFNLQDEAGNLHQLAQNLVKLRNVTTGGSAGSSTITGYDSEYTLSVKKYGEAGPTNSLTSNKDFTEVAEELRVVNKAVNSGNTDLSGVYLTYDGAETGTPSAILQLRDKDDDENTQNIKLEQARTTFGTVTKQYKASSDPTGEAGDTYFNTTTNKFRGHNGTAWVDLS